MTQKKVTLEDLSDQIDCIARSISRLIQTLSKPPTYIERGYRC